MGSQQSTESQQGHTNNPHTSEGHQLDLNALSHITGLDLELIRWLHKKVFKGREVLSKQSFLELLSSDKNSLQKIGLVLYNITRNFSLLEELDLADDLQEDGNLTFRTVVHTISLLLGQHTNTLPKHRPRLILEVLSKSEQTTKEISLDPDFSRNTFYDLVESLYSLFLYNFNNSNQGESKSTIRMIENYPLDLVSFLFKDSTYLPTSQIQNFFSIQFPRWIELLESFISYTFLDLKENNLRPNSGFLNSDFAPLIKDPPVFFNTKDLFHLVMSIIPDHKKGREAGNIPVWDRLYDSAEHGYSINRFETHVFKYPGPTLLVIRGVVASEYEDAEDQDIVIAVYLEDTWKKSKQPWGGQNTRIFELSPFFECFVSSGQRQGHVLVNNQQGICVGPSAPASSSSQGIFLLDIKSSLQSATYAGWVPYIECPAFKPSPHRNISEKPFKSGSEVSFDVDDLMVYGLGGEPARKRQNADWKFEEADATRRANISALSNPHDPANRQILEMAGIVSEENPSVYRATREF